MYHIKKNKSKNGITLIEVMVAMVILSIGFYTTNTIFPLGFLASKRSKNRTIATQLAQQKMEDIINNREPIDCYNHKTNADCRCFPVNVGYANYNYDNLTYDCRNFYGGKSENGKVKNSTFCSHHMGTDDDINWKPFALQNNMWWYHIDVIPVVDPAEKFRSRGSLMKITVRVRGPFWNNVGLSDSKMKSKDIVEVVYSTLQANKFVGAGNITGVTVPADPDKIGTVINVDNIRNFTVFNEDKLTTHEKFDPPKVSLFGHHKYKTPTDESDDRYLMMVKQGGNFYNLDNIEIIKKITVKDITVPVVNQQEIEVQVIMSNKIVFIEVDDSITNPDTTEKISGKIHLFTKLLSGDNPEHGYRTFWSKEEIPETDPVGSPSDLLWWRGSKFQNFINCNLYDSSSNSLWDDRNQTYWVGGQNSYTNTYQVRQCIGPFRPAQQNWW